MFFQKKCVWRHRQHTPKRLIMDSWVDCFACFCFALFCKPVSRWAFVRWQALTLYAVVLLRETRIACFCSLQPHCFPFEMSTLRTPTDSVGLFYYPPILFLLNYVFCCCLHIFSRGPPAFLILPSTVILPTQLRLITIQFSLDAFAWT